MIKRTRNLHLVISRAHSIQLKYAVNPLTEDEATNQAKAIAKLLISYVPGVIFDKFYTEFINPAFGISYDAWSKAIYKFAGVYLDD